MAGVSLLVVCAPAAPFVVVTTAAFVGVASGFISGGVTGNKGARVAAAAIGDGVAGGPVGIATGAVAGAATEALGARLGMATVIGGAIGAPAGAAQPMRPSRLIASNTRL